MKKISIKISLLIFLIFSSTNANAGAYGKGDLKLNSDVTNWFIKYIKGKHTESPGIFYVTLDGSGAYYWYCQYGAGNCQFNSYQQMELQCERAYQKECKAFALARTIKWKNGINPGKGKKSKINSRLSDTEIRNQLRDLGFLN